MREPIESMTHLILASGRSTRHLRKMSDTIVQAVSSLWSLVLNYLQLPVTIPEVILLFILSLCFAHLLSLIERES